MEHGGVQVMDMHLLVDGPEAVLVGDAVDHASTHTTSGHPGTEAFGVVAPAVLGFVSEGKILEVGGSSKLTRPDQERVVEQSPGFEVRDQAGCRLVYGDAFLGKTLTNRFVMVPAT